jgi:L-aminopeptidase/D-esterase-like protein
MASNGSGDIFVAFSTANPGAAQRAGVSTLEMLPNDRMTPLFESTVYATEEAIVNALVAAKAMTGRDGHTVHGLPHERLQQVLSAYGRLQR